MTKYIHILGGGTVSHIRNHLALSTPAYGTTARKLFDIAAPLSSIQSRLHLTKMANSGKGDLETNEDINNLIQALVADKNTKIIFFNVALTDFSGSIDNISGKYETRLKTSEGNKTINIVPADKIISSIRKERKDIFLVGFKTTCGATEDEQFIAGLNLLKTSGCNLVLANDTKTRTNMIITPEQARYHVSNDRDMVLKKLFDMAIYRSQGTFTRSNVVDGDSIDWNSKEIPESLRTVVNYCISKGAYKPFNNSTVGHFAVKVNDKEFITSKRKTNFNNLNEVGMVRCEAIDTNNVTAYGAKPSVGGQSQRIIFKDHPEMDSIVHFHVPPKSTAKLSIREQTKFECGSHQCGQNTSDGLREEVKGIKCVYLDKHGPNIVFNRNIDPYKVISFIESNFDLSQSTDELQR